MATIASVRPANSDFLTLVSVFFVNFLNLIGVFSA